MSKQAGYFFKFCGLLRKPQLYREGLFKPTVYRSEYEAKLGKKSFLELPETVQITQIFLTQMVRSICPDKLPIYKIGDARCFCERNSG